jgi:WD40 repeat protein
VFSSDGRRVLVSSADNTARVYDAETGAPVGPPARQPGTWQGTDVDTDGRRLAVYDAPADALRVWDAERGERLLTLRLGNHERLYGIWFSRDGQWINAVMGRSLYTFPLPRFDAPKQQAGPLVRFLTGQQIDETDGIEFVDQFTFRKDPDTYRRAVQAWKRLPAN